MAWAVARAAALARRRRVARFPWGHGTGAGPAGSSVPRRMRSLRAGPTRRHARSGRGFRTRHALVTRHPLAARHGVPGHAVTSGHGVAVHAFAALRTLAARHAFAARHGVAGSRCLPRAHVIAGRHGRAAWTVRRPGGARRAHPRLVAGTRRRGSGPAGRRPVLASPAGWRTRTLPSLAWNSLAWNSLAWNSLAGRSGEGRSLAGAAGERRSLGRAAGDEATGTGFGGTQDLRDGLAVRCGGSVTVPRRADQAARGVHVRGVQHGRPSAPRPAAARVAITRGGPAAVLIPAVSRRVRSRGSGRPGVPGRRRGLPAGGFPAVSGRGWPRPRLGCVPAPSESEDHQDHQSEGGSGRDHVQAHPGQVSGRERGMLGDVRHDHARGQHEGAEHDRRGSRNRQDGDEAHPPGRGGFRAHWSTIASRLPPRKPNSQV